MKLEDLTLFALASRHGSLTAAGRELGLSPAAASARLSSLEKTLGTSLMARTTRSLSLTEDGAAFLAHAQIALEALENGRAALSASQATPSGVLRATLPGPFGRKHILPFLSEFREAYPQVRLDLHASDDVVNLIEEGYDLGIRIGVAPDSALIKTHLAPNRRVVIATPEFISKHGKPMHPQECASFEAAYQPNLRNWHFTRGAEHASVRVDGPIRTNDGGVVHTAVLSSLAIGMKSIWDVGEDLKAGRLVRLLEDWDFASDGEIYAVRPSGATTPPKTRAFIDFLKSKYGPVPYWEM